MFLRLNCFFGPSLESRCGRSLLEVFGVVVINCSLLDKIKLLDVNFHIVNILSPQFFVMIPPYIATLS